MQSKNTLIGQERFVEMIQLKIVNKTTFSTILETTLRLEIGRKFRNSSWLSKRFLRSGDRTADLRDRAK